MPNFFERPIHSALHKEYAVRVYKPHADLAGYSAG